MANNSHFVALSTKNKLHSSKDGQDSSSCQPWLSFISFQTFSRYDRKAQFCVYKRGIMGCRDCVEQIYPLFTFEAIIVEAEYGWNRQLHPARLIRGELFTKDCEHSEAGTSEVLLGHSSNLSHWITTKLRICHDSSAVVAYAKCHFGRLGKIWSNWILVNFQIMMHLILVKLCPVIPTKYFGHTG